jgi:hypothetical protein
MRWDWVLFVVLAWVVYKWLQSGAGIYAQTYPSGWGSGMMYGPGSAWMNAYQYKPQVASFITADSQGNVAFQYGF